MSCPSTHTSSKVSCLQALGQKLRGCPLCLKKGSVKKDCSLQHRQSGLLFLLLCGLPVSLECFQPET